MKIMSDSWESNRLALFGAIAFVSSALCQGTFQNLDFENGTFVPIAGQFNSVEFAPAVPGWTGYLGANQIDWILHNSLFLSDAGIAIWGPSQPQPGLLHGQFYVVLQDSFPVPSTVPALAQTGMVPVTAQSVRFYTLDFNPLIGVAFAGASLPMTRLGGSLDSYYTWGANISGYAGQTGELRLFGNGYLDNIHFSVEAIPEPGVLSLLAVGALLFGWRLRITSMP
jgi:hypothetical protein